MTPDIERSAQEAGADGFVFALRLTRNGVTSRQLDRVLMLEVALQAGFGSLRRFNAVFAEIDRRPPGEI